MIGAVDIGSPSGARAALAVARLAFVAGGILGSACAGNGLVDVEYREVEHAFSRAERRTIERIAEDTVAEVQRLLPAVPDRLVLRVDADDRVSETTFATAAAVVPNRLYWSVDPERGDGVAATAETHLRPMLFHELHHLVRDVRVERVSLMDEVVSEGMAAAFERDYAGARYPFSDYPDGAAAWVTELMALDPATDRERWLFRHPDGRRWIGFRAGTFLVDQATHASGLSSADLVTTATAEVLRLAGYGAAEPRR